MVLCVFLFSFLVCCCCGLFAACPSVLYGPARPARSSRPSVPSRPLGVGMRPARPRPLSGTRPGSAKQQCCQGLDLLLLLIVLIRQGCGLVVSFFGCGLCFCFQCEATVIVTGAMRRLRWILYFHLIFPWTSGSPTITKNIDVNTPLCGFDRL